MQTLDEYRINFGTTITVRGPAAWTPEELAQVVSLRLAGCNAQVLGFLVNDMPGVGWEKGWCVVYYDQGPGVVAAPIDYENAIWHTVTRL